MFNFKNAEFSFLKKIGNDYVICVNCLSSLTHLIHAKVGGGRHTSIMYHLKAKFTEDALVSN